MECSDIMGCAFPAATRCRCQCEWLTLMPHKPLFFKHFCGKYYTLNSGGRQVRVRLTSHRPKWQTIPLPRRPMTPHTLICPLLNGNSGRFYTSFCKMLRTPSRQTRPHERDGSYESIVLVSSCSPLYPGLLSPGRERSVPI